MKLFPSEENMDVTWPVKSVTLFMCWKIASKERFQRKPAALPLSTITFITYTTTCLRPNFLLRANHPKPYWSLVHKSQFKGHKVRPSQVTVLLLPLNNTHTCECDTAVCLGFDCWYWAVREGRWTQRLARRLKDSCVSEWMRETGKMKWKTDPWSAVSTASHHIYWG